MELWKATPYLLFLCVCVCLYSTAHMYLGVWIKVSVCVLQSTWCYVHVTLMFLPEFLSKHLLCMVVQWTVDTLLAFSCCFCLCKIQYISDAKLVTTDICFVSSRPYFHVYLRDCGFTFFAWQLAWVFVCTCSVHMCVDDIRFLKAGLSGHVLYQEIRCQLEQLFRPFLQ